MKKRNAKIEWIGAFATSGISVVGGINSDFIIGNVFPCNVHDDDMTVDAGPPTSSVEVVPDSLSVVNSVKGVASLITEGGAKSIVFVMGPGTSAAAGLPDMTPHGGYLPSKISQERGELYDLTAKGFQKNPKTLNSFGQDFLLAQPKMSVAQLFPLFLYKKNMMKGVCTYNSDGLERICGIPGNMIVEMAGSISDVKCVSCQKPKELSQYFKEVKAFNGKLGTVPCCDHCHDVVKPSIRMLGEDFQEDQVLQAKTMMQEADLVITMGIDKISTISSHKRHFPSQCPFVIMSKTAPSKFGTFDNLKDAIRGEGIDSLVNVLGEDLKKEFSNFVQNYRENLTSKNSTLCEMLEATNKVD